MVIQSLFQQRIAVTHEIHHNINRLPALFFTAKIAYALSSSIADHLRGGYIPRDPGNRGQAQVHLRRDLAQRLAGSPKIRHLLPIGNHPWATANAALLACALQAGNGALAQPNAFLLGNRCQDTEHGITKHAARVEVLFREALPADTVGRELL
jgi:hypothetical protein